jgi:chitobiase/beta-hexosaminidase-like protein
VTISDATPGASIYYTTDGTAPTTASTLYGGRITINVTTTIKALAAGSGYSNSVVASANYTIQPSTSPVAAPAFDPAPGTYDIPWGSDYTLWVSLSDTTAGAAIFYALDGTTPTAESIPYTGPIDLGFAASTTINTIAIAGGVTSSPASGTYVLTQTYPGWCLVNNGQLTGDCVSQTYLGCLDGPSTVCTGSATSSSGYVCGDIPVDKTCSFVGAPLQPF